MECVHKLTNETNDARNERYTKRTIHETNVTRHERYTKRTIHEMNDTRNERTNYTKEMQRTESEKRKNYTRKRNERKTPTIRNIC